ncbi:MAG: hypothetical protein AMXMBFR33_69410 [Candidatus Xenobia bacterium]
MSRLYHGREGFAGPERHTMSFRRGSGVDTLGRAGLNQGTAGPHPVGVETIAL